MLEKRVTVYGIVGVVVATRIVREGFRAEYLVLLDPRGVAVWAAAADVVQR